MYGEKATQATRAYRSYKHIDAQLIRTIFDSPKDSHIHHGAEVEYHALLGNGKDREWRSDLLPAAKNGE